MIRNTPKAALKTPIEMLHAERFFTSSIKLCADIRASRSSRIALKEGRPFDLPSDRCRTRPRIPALRGFGLRSRCFCLEHLDLRLRLTLGSLASLFGLLQLILDLGIEFVDLFLELRFAVGVSLGLLGLHLGHVGLHGSHVLFVNGV